MLLDHWNCCTHPMDASSTFYLSGHVSGAGSPALSLPCIKEEAELWFASANSVTKRDKPRSASKWLSRSVLFGEPEPLLKNFMRAVMDVSSITATLHHTVKTYAEGVIHQAFRKKRLGLSAALLVSYKPRPSLLDTGSAAGPTASESLQVCPVKLGLRWSGLV